MTLQRIPSTRVAPARVFKTLMVDSDAGFATILVSGGRRGFDLELAPADLLAATGGRYADIRRG